MNRTIALTLALATILPSCSTGLSREMAAVRDYVPAHANIAHRGTTYWAPEETEASWRWARHMGTDYLEADLQCSKDAIMLAVHDNSFGRTTDIGRVFGEAFPSAVRRIFYRSFRNGDGSQHFADIDIEEQVRADSLLGVAGNARDYYYAEILMLDAGGWFNAANPERAREAFASDGAALPRTLESGSIVYSNGQYVSALSDMVAFASGQVLRRGGRWQAHSRLRHPPGLRGDDAAADSRAHARAKGNGAGRQPLRGGQPLYGLRRIRLRGCLSGR